MWNTGGHRGKTQKLFDHSFSMGNFPFRGVHTVPITLTPMLTALRVGSAVIKLLPQSSPKLQILHVVSNSTKSYNGEHNLLLLASPRGNIADSRVSSQRDFLERAA